MLDSPLPLREYCLTCIRDAVVDVEVRDKGSIGGSASSSDPQSGLNSNHTTSNSTSSLSSADETGPNARHHVKAHPAAGYGHHQHQQQASHLQSRRPDRSSSQSSLPACPTSRSSSSGSIFDDLTSFPDEDLMSVSVSRFLSRSNVLSSCHLIAGISESLLTSLSDEGRLTDNILTTIFHPDNCRLESACIPDASQLTKRGLRVLRGHKIRHLEVISLQKATINELIGCLGDYTLNNICHLSVSRSYFTSSARFCVVVGLAKLRNLKHLDVSHTDINHHGLEIIVEDLPNLVSLNISSTRVRDLLPLRKCKTRLRYLSMYNLRPGSSGEHHPRSDFNSVLLELNLLIKLDISDDRDSPVDNLNRGSHSVGPLLKRPDLLPDLRYLDISGKEGIELEDLKKFVSYKHGLGDEHRVSFLGLMQTDICANDAFIAENNSSYKEYTDMTVTGFATEQQILNSLTIYADRPAFIQKSLCYLYNYTINDMTDPRIDMIDTILPVMKRHSKVIGIQMAATACLYNLTKGKIADKIHPKWLAKVVNATLLAMETFPNHQQLQKNTLLTLCSDRILQEVVSPSSQWTILSLALMTKDQLKIILSLSLFSACCLLLQTLAPDPSCIRHPGEQHMHTRLHTSPADLQSLQVHETSHGEFSELQVSIHPNPSSISVVLQDTPSLHSTLAVHIM